MNPSSVQDSINMSTRYAQTPSYDTTLTLTPSRLAAKTAAVEINPATHLPYKFKVGSWAIPPFVTVPELVQHLIFLACLHRLQQDVRECPTPDEVQVPGDVKWAAFCTRAARRFEEWASSTRMAVFGRMLNGRAPTPQEVDGMLEGVDIDVLMVWHTYLLNPGAYDEDMDREGRYSEGKFRGFRALGPFPLAQVCERIDQESFVFQPHKLVPVAPAPGYSNSNDQSPFVAPPPAYTTHPISLIEIHPTETRVDVRCPKCNLVHSVPLLGAETIPQGYATNDFILKCQCGLLITRETLRVGRFLRDLVRADQKRAAEIPFLAGLGEQISFGKDTTQAGEALTEVLVGVAYRLSGDARELDASHLGDVCGWTFQGVRTSLLGLAAKDHLYLPLLKGSAFGTSGRVTFRQLLGSALRRLGRVYADHDGIASLNLGAAVMRQAAFVSSMERIGWLNIERWTQSTDETRFYLLQKAVARYHAFLHLMERDRGKFLSPTLDIDLGWHTHQLHGRKYALETRKYTGSFVDHDDKIADVALKSAYDKTARMWAAAYGVPYSGCGCPTAKEVKKQLDDTLKRKHHQSSGLKFWKIRENRRKSIAEGQENIAALMSEMPTEERGASCPSTHNLVHFAGLRKMDAMRHMRGIRTPTGPEDHTNPFTARYVFVPRRVGGTRRAAFGPPRASRDTRDGRNRGDDPHMYALMYGYPLYWGVAPYGFGPYPMADPWCIPANQHGGGGGGGCGGAACAAGAGGAGAGNCCNNSACGSGGGFGGCGTGGCAGGLGGGCGSGGCASGAGACGGGGGGAGCGGGGGGCGGGGGGGGCGGGGGGGGC